MKILKMALSIELLLSCLCMPFALAGNPHATNVFLAFTALGAAWALFVHEPERGMDYLSYRISAGIALVASIVLAWNGWWFCFAAWMAIASRNVEMAHKAEEANHDA